MSIAAFCKPSVNSTFTFASELKLAANKITLPISYSPIISWISSLIVWTDEILVPSLIVHPLRKDNINFCPIFSSNVILLTSSLAFSALVSALTLEMFALNTVVTAIDKAIISEMILLFPNLFIFLLLYPSLV